MRLQIWYVENIENIIWATQAIGQTGTTLSAGNRQPAAYYQAFKHGSETTLAQTVRLCNDKSWSQEIWSREQILNILLATQTAMQATAMTLTIQTEIEAYQQGFNQGCEVALRSTATAFGLSLSPAENDSGPIRCPGVLPNPGPWFQADIQNILLAIKMTMQAIIETSDQLAHPEAYNNGFEAALRYVAKSFGAKLLSGDISVPLQNVRYWLRQDIKHELHIAYQTIPTITAPANSDAELAAYYQGFAVVLKGLSTSFGLKPGL